jgi:uncharacterized protein
MEKRQVIKQMKKTIVLFVLFFGVVLLVAGSMCFAAGSKIMPLYIGDKKFRVEIADTPDKRSTGLMYREYIADDFGMLFIMDDEEIQAFWMKNCKVHLDIIYLDSNKQVVDMYIDVPPCKSEPCATYESRKPARYVLELRGKRAKEINLKIGDNIFFIPGY